MAYSVYILYSEQAERHYCGSTNDLERRLQEHNDPEYHGSKTTKRFHGPWKLIWAQDTDSRAGAMALERQIKKRGIVRFLADREKLSR